MGIDGLWAKKGDRMWLNSTQEAFICSNSMDNCLHIELECPYTNVQKEGIEGMKSMTTLSKLDIYTIHTLRGKCGVHSKKD